LQELNAKPASASNQQVSLMDTCMQNCFTVSAHAFYESFGSPSVFLFYKAEALHFSFHLY